MVIDFKQLRKQRATELKKCRIEAGLTQIKVFELSGLRTGTIRTMETGEKSWNIDSELLYVKTIFDYVEKNKSA